MDDSSAPPAGIGAGFISGNETTFNFTDDDIVPSDVEISRSASGWLNFSDFLGNWTIVFGDQPLIVLPVTPTRLNQILIFSNSTHCAARA